MLEALGRLERAVRDVTDAQANAASEAKNSEAAVRGDVKAAADVLAEVLEQVAGVARGVSEMEPKLKGDLASLGSSVDAVEVAVRKLSPRLSSGRSPTTHPWAAVPRPLSPGGDKPGAASGEGSSARASSGGGGAGSAEALRVAESRVGLMAARVRAVEAERDDALVAAEAAQADLIRLRAVEEALVARLSGASGQGGAVAATAAAAAALPGDDALDVLSKAGYSAYLRERARYNELYTRHLRMEAERNELRTTLVSVALLRAAAAAARRLANTRAVVGCVGGRRGDGWRAGRDGAVDGGGATVGLHRAAAGKVSGAHAGVFISRVALGECTHHTRCALIHVWRTPRSQRHWSLNLPVSVGHCTATRRGICDNGSVAAMAGSTARPATDTGDAAMPGGAGGFLRRGRRCCCGGGGVLPATGTLAVEPNGIPAASASPSSLDDESELPPHASTAGGGCPRSPPPSPTPPPPSPPAVPRPSRRAVGLPRAGPAGGAARSAVGVLTPPGVGGAAAGFSASMAMLICSHGRVFSMMSFSAASCAAKASTLPCSDDRSSSTCAQRRG